MSFGNDIGREVGRQTFRLLTAFVVAAFVAGVGITALGAWAWPYLPSVRVVWP